MDCDPGLDDAVAIFLALAAPDTLDVQAITTVAGNVPLSMTARNARMICDLADRKDIPVYAGCPQPLWREAVSAEDFHGETGLEGIPLFDPETPLQTKHAVSFLIEMLRGRSEPITLVVTGPMTNIAMAIRQAPDILDQIDEIVLMGGADTEGGNITPHAEFNAFADPHAAEIVLNCGASMTALSLDVTHTLRMTNDRIAAIEALGTSVTGHVANLMRATNAFEKKQNDWPDGPLHDPSTIAYLLAPDLFSGRMTKVSVTTDTGDEFGKTQPDYSGDGTINWITAADQDAVFAMMTERFGRAT